MYAYALDAIEQHVRMKGGSVLEARENFAREFGVGEPATRQPVASRRGEQARAQEQLMGRMGRARA